MNTLIKQIWAQRRANGWIFFELILIFVVAWMAIDPIYVIQYQRQGIKSGFEPDDMYAVSVGAYSNIAQKYDVSRDTKETLNEDLQRMVNLVKTYPGVVAVCGVDGNKPYSGSYMGTSIGNPKDSTSYGVQILSIPGQDYFEVFRFSSALDHKWESLDALEVPTNGVIISEDTRRTVFGKDAAIGKAVLINDQPFIVSGVMDMVKRAPSSQPGMCILVPIPFIPIGQFSWNNVQLMIRVKPGTSGKVFMESFNNDLVPKLQYGNLFINDIKPFSDYGKDMSTWDDSDNTLQLRSIITIFFLLVVFLGVISTFWLRVETRKEEIGIRMAAGSTAGKIRRRLMGESILLVLFSSLIGLVIVANIAYFKGMYSFRPTKIADFWPVNSPVPHFIFVTLIVLVLLVAIVAIATAIPASRAASIKPVDALKDE